MNGMSNDIISLREFARRLNIGEKTIRDGVRLGKISKGVIIENGKPKINYPVALIEAQSIGLGHKAMTNKGIEPQEAKQTIPKELKPDESVTISSIDESTTFIEATRIQKVGQARTAIMEADRMAGTLVNKSEVYIQLFEFGTHIRSEFESMPGRIAPKIATINDSSRVAEMLAKEIGLSLNKLLDKLDERKIN